MQKFYWSNQQQSYTSDKCKSFHNVPCPGHIEDEQHMKLYNDLSSLTLSINTPTQVQNFNNKTKTKISHQDQVINVRVRAESLRKKSLDNVVNNSNKVVLRLGDVAIDNPEITTIEGMRSTPTSVRQYNRTWNENTKSQYNELLRGRQRKSIQNTNIFHHDYENVYDDNDFAVKDKKCPSSSARNTPRSRKKKKQQQNSAAMVYRSKSCERVTNMSMLDKLSEKLSIHSDNLSPPSTPTPSLFQSVAARAIPCVDIQAPCISPSTGRMSPTDSLAYEGVTGQSADIYRDLLRPAANLADRMRGRLEYVNKKMKIIRSRSAERLRGYILSEANNQTPDTEVSGQSSPSSSSQSQQCSPLEPNIPILGHARAIVSCVPSPYHKDALSFQAGDIIDIIQMNPNGMWRGRCGDKVGQFKFVNVEMLPRRRGRRRSRSRSLRRNNDRPIRNIYEVMKILDMAEHLPVFVLNGYEDLTLFKDLDEEELDYLGIHDSKHREKLIEMAAVLFPDENKTNTSNISDNESLHVVDNEPVNDFNYNRRK